MHRDPVKSPFILFITGWPNKSFERRKDYLPRVAGRGKAEARVGDDGAARFLAMRLLRSALSGTHPGDAPRVVAV